MCRLLIGLLAMGVVGCTADEKSETGQAGDDEHAHHHGDTDVPDDFDPTTEVVSESGITVSYTTDPAPIPESAEFSVTFSLSAGMMREGTDQADATMPTHGGHGMNVFPEVTDNGDGTYTATPFEFHMPGYWVIHAIVVDENGDEERVDFEVDCCE